MPGFWSKVDMHLLAPPAWIPTREIPKKKTFATLFWVDQIMVIILMMRLMVFPKRTSWCFPPWQLPETNIAPARKPSIKRIFGTISVSGRVNFIDFYLFSPVFKPQEPTEDQQLRPETGTALSLPGFVNRIEERKKWIQYKSHTIYICMAYILTFILKSTKWR